MEEGTLLLKIKEIIDKHDPIRLLKIGCPEDEYHPEIQIIAPILEDSNSTDELHNSVYELFVQWFSKDDAGAKENYIELSEELYALKNL